MPSNPRRAIPKPPNRWQRFNTWMGEPIPTSDYQHDRISWTGWLTAIGLALLMIADHWAPILTQLAKELIP